MLHHTHIVIIRQKNYRMGVAYEIRWKHFVYFAYFNQFLNKITFNVSLLTSKYSNTVNIFNYTMNKTS